ncbi:MAG: transporter substrate-binding domain-containing protein [Pseudomonadota bacterium]
MQLALTPMRPMRWPSWWRMVLRLAIVLSALSAAYAGDTPDGSEESPGDEAVFDLAMRTWTGDLDGIVERGFLRLGTVHSPLLLSYDGPEQSGIMVDGAEELRKFLVERLGRPAQNLTVAVLPLSRDQLLPALVMGRVDLVSANITVTPERAEQVDFTTPLRRGVRELVVTGPAMAKGTRFDDLVTTGLHMRASSSYAERLSSLNAERTAAGHAPIPLRAEDERLEDHDLLEMVSAGAIPAVVVDEHKAELWSEVFDRLVLHDDLVLSSEGDIALALRKDSPQLLETMNAFAETVKKGSLLGNILRKRFFSDTDRMVDALDPEHESRFRETLNIINKYAEDYAFEPLLIAAQGFQESRLDQSKTSDAGAVGIMQVLPKTARDPNVSIPDIHVADRNVEAGVKYLRFLRDHYFDDLAIEPKDRVFFGFAAYNAGPGNIRKARGHAEKLGLDPNRWFNNVEIATARFVGREPVVYVRNILKYYSQYRSLKEAEDSP